MTQVKIVALTHKNFELTRIGQFHIADTEQLETLGAIKQALQLDELMYLSTCNRVEFIFVQSGPVSKTQIRGLFEQLDLLDIFEDSYPKLNIYEGKQAVRHVFEVASSIDSMVLGEREILTQFRKAFEYANAKQLSGDTLRILTRQTIEVAKQIYTETKIAEKPVSVVSLSFKEFLKTGVAKDAPIAIIGAGQTNGNMLRFLTKTGYNNICIYNRTLAKAQSLAKSFNLKAKNLGDLGKDKETYAAIISCTGSDKTVVDAELFSQLTNGNANAVAIDLAVPADIDPVVGQEGVTLINMAYLHPISLQNLKFREQELTKCNAILDERLLAYNLLIKERRIELALREIPNEMKAIREKAFTSVFNKDIEGLDADAKILMERLADYLEKKFVAIPYKHSKKLITQNSLEQ